MEDASKADRRRVLSRENERPAETHLVNVGDDICAFVDPRYLPHLRDELTVG